MIDRVVLATDGSRSVERAVAVGLDLADRFGAAVYALYVLDEGQLAGTPDPVRTDLRQALQEDGEEALTQIADSSSGSSAVQTVVRTGRPADEIIAYAGDVDADLVAMGTRGRHGEHRFVLGSVAESVVRDCSIPVLSVRQLDPAQP